MQTQLFYNTIDLSGEPLKRAIQRSSTQEDTVLACYKMYAEPLTAYEVFRLTGMGCINSTRRAITNLYKQGLLVKTDIKRMGGFGVENYCYRIK